MAVGVQETIGAPQMQVAGCMHCPRDVTAEFQPQVRAWTSCRCCCDAASCADHTTTTSVYLCAFLSNRQLMPLREPPCCLPSCVERCAARLRMVHDPKGTFPRCALYFQFSVLERVFFHSASLGALALAPWNGSGVEHCPRRGRTREIPVFSGFSGKMPS